MDLEDRLTDKQKHDILRDIVPDIMIEKMSQIKQDYGHGHISQADAVYICLTLESWLQETFNFWSERDFNNVIDGEIWGFDLDYNGMNDQEREDWVQKYNPLTIDAIRSDYLSEFDFMFAYLNSRYVVDAERKLKGPDELKTELQKLVRLCPDYDQLKRILKVGEAKDLDEMVECQDINLNHYTVLRRSGSGSSKRVYKAIYQKPGFNSMTVALKIINNRHTSDSSNMADLAHRFGIDKMTQHEVTQGLTVNHPRITRILDFGSTSDGKLYFAEQYVEGKTLRELFDMRKQLISNVKNNREIIYGIILQGERNEEYTVIENGEVDYSFEKKILTPTQRVVHYYLGLCISLVEALEPLHIQHQTAHLDIKPENCIVKGFSKNHPEAYLTDMQISRVAYDLWKYDLDKIPKKLKGVHGSRNYAAPELLKGEAITLGADLYSIGVILYEAITGHLPFGPYKQRKDAREDHSVDHEEKLQSALKEIENSGFDEFIPIISSCLSSESLIRYGSDNINVLFDDLRKAYGRILNHENVIIDGEEVNADDFRQLNLLRQEYGAERLTSILDATRDMIVDIEGRLC